ncbi:helix-turn-helix domain-containing protein [Lactococcus taiwanensis]|uniref:helix-turn-helix domain-containing protein n=1 Tax=Lactococcus taiwanensis TaxID=1151742 RepID=UPI00289A0EBC|nr:helix-turn-helix domain-containing protein [Lactococcus taiwanensis]
MIEVTIGNQLKHYRELRNLSLDEVAAMTGVSKPSLSNIERGNTSPSISTLWKISKGLSLPISYFFAEKEVTYEIESINNLRPIESESDLIKIFTAFKWNPNDTFEVLFLELDPGAKRQSKAHSSETREIIIPLEGTLEIVIQNEKISLSANEIMRFDAGVDHEYNNNSALKTKFICIMIYNSLSEK